MPTSQGWLKTVLYLQILKCYLVWVFTLWRNGWCQWRKIDGRVSEVDGVVGSMRPMDHVIKQLRSQSWTLAASLPNKILPKSLALHRELLYNTGRRLWICKNKKKKLFFYFWTPRQGGVKWCDLWCWNKKWQNSRIRRRTFSSIKKTAFCAAKIKSENSRPVK